MSSSDRLLLILHIGFAIFALGPLTAATMASPRYIRLRQVQVLRYLNRATRIYGLLTLGIFLFGLLLADGDFSRVWLTASMTLFIVALVLLLIVERDQRKAVHAIELAEAAPAERPPANGTPAAEATGARVSEARASETRASETRASEAAGTGGEAGAAGTADGTPAADATAAAKGPAPASVPPIAQVEQGRIAAISGVIALLWLVILFLMIWYGR